jgi:hypothetical protein
MDHKQESFNHEIAMFIAWLRRDGINTVHDLKVQRTQNSQLHGLTVDMST